MTPRRPLGFFTLLCLLLTAAAARPARVVFMIGEEEYQTATTLPRFAHDQLQPRGIQTTIVQADQREPNDFPGLTDALPKADLLVISARRRLPDAKQLQAIREYLDSGRPLVGIRTACHAFALPLNDHRVPAGHDSWEQFDSQVLGCHYSGHYDAGLLTSIAVASDAKESRVLSGLDVSKLVGHGSLYKVSPLDSGCTVLLTGRIAGKPAEPVAWTRTYGKRKARIFYTSLGHPDDFAEPQFKRLILNGMLWALDAPAAAKSNQAP